MLVKMLKTAAGPEGVWPKGQVVDVEPDEGAQLIADGAAEAVEESRPSKAQAETATVASQETAEAGPRPRRRKGA